MKIKVLNKDDSLKEIIERKPFNKGFLGNFIPYYVRYKKQIYLIQGGIDYAYMHDNFFIQTER